MIRLLCFALAILASPFKSKCRVGEDVSILTPVCTEILNSGVVVMEPAKDGARIDDTGPLNRARDRRILVQ
jgi:hypothetical protein